MLVDESSVRIDVSRSVVTSALNRARYPQSLVKVMTTDEVSPLLDFDYCSLVLPESTGHGLRLWLASRSANAERRVSTEDSLGRAERLLASVAGTSSPR